MGEETPTRSQSLVGGPPRRAPHTGSGQLLLPGAPPALPSCDDLAEWGTFSRLNYPSVHATRPCGSCARPVPVREARNLAPGAATLEMAWRIVEYGHCGGEAHWSMLYGSLVDPHASGRGC